MYGPCLSNPGTVLACPTSSGCSPSRFSVRDDQQSDQDAGGHEDAPEGQDGNAERARLGTHCEGRYGGQRALQAGAGLIAQLCSSEMVGQSDEGGRVHEACNEGQPNAARGVSVSESRHDASVSVPPSPVAGRSLVERLEAGRPMACSRSDTA
jgi:hypothetical protein